MVDPNRKINRFTDRDIEFLEECEKEFSSRYSEEDVEFMEHCAKPLADPPILENFSLNNHSSGHSYQQNRRYTPYQQRASNRGWRDYNDGGGNRNYRPRRGRDGGNRSFGGQNGYDRGHNNRREPYPSNRPPMNIRRDYANFVAASKED